MEEKKLEKNVIEDLIHQAFEAQAKAYVPYSQFAVGAALLARGGRIYQGCNIENASYTPTNCAERTAFFKAVSEGITEFDAIAIVGNKKFVPKGEGDYCPPCGVCRQVMAEFCDPKTFQVLLVKPDGHFKKCTLEQLLPGAFTQNDLEKGIQ